MSNTGIDLFFEGTNILRSKIAWLHDDYTVHINMQFLNLINRYNSISISVGKHYHEEMNFIGCVSSNVNHNGNKKKGIEKLVELYEFVDNLDEDKRLLFFGKAVQILSFFNSYSLDKIANIKISDTHYYIRRFFAVLYRLQHDESILLESPYLNSYCFKCRSFLNIPKDKYVRKFCSEKCRLSIDRDMYDIYSKGIPNDVFKHSFRLGVDQDIYYVDNKTREEYYSKIMEFMPDSNTDYYKLLAYRYLLQVDVIKVLANIICSYLPSFKELYDFNIQAENNSKKWYER